MHTPVLLSETIEALAVKKGGTYIDATVGEGGHLKKILEKGGKVLGIDWDESQIKQQQERDRLKLIAGNFADIERIAKENGFSQVDGILFDLGLSYGQLMRSGRGFSYKAQDEPLDLRLNKNSEGTATDLINSLSESELYEIFARNAEEINSQAIASSLVATRREKRVETVGELTKEIDRVIGSRDEKVYARIFQALRMEVNSELENLRKGLQGALNLIRDDGRIVVITFHSVEDRLVKRFINDHKLKQIEKTKGRGGADYEKSATLRVFTK